jgi:hypothetical protein
MNDSISCSFSTPARSPAKITFVIRWFIARWLEQEIYKLRFLGVSLRVIAETIPRVVVRSEGVPAVPLPPAFD